METPNIREEGGNTTEEVVKGIDPQVIINNEESERLKSELLKKEEEVEKLKGQLTNKVQKEENKTEEPKSENPIMMSDKEFSLFKNRKFIEDEGIEEGSPELEILTKYYNAGVIKDFETGRKNNAEISKVFEEQSAKREAEKYVDEDDDIIFVKELEDKEKELSEGKEPTTAEERHELASHLYD